MVQCRSTVHASGSDFSRRGECADWRGHDSVRLHFVAATALLLLTTSVLAHGQDRSASLQQLVVSTTDPPPPAHLDRSLFAGVNHEPKTTTNSYTEPSGFVHRFITIVTSQFGAGDTQEFRLI